MVTMVIIRGNHRDYNSSGIVCEINKGAQRGQQSERGKSPAGRNHPVETVLSVLASMGELKRREAGICQRLWDGLSCHFVQAPEDEDVERHLQTKVSGFQSNICTFIATTSQHAALPATLCICFMTTSHLKPNNAHLHQ